MLCRSRNGAFSLSAKALTIFTHSLHSSSSSSVKFNPRITVRKPASVSAWVHRDLALQTVSSSDANSICCLLSDQSLQCNDFDSLLKDYKQKLDSHLVLQVLSNYRQLGRIKTLKFFSWAGGQMGFQFDDCVIEYMADFLGRRKLFDDMKCFLLTLLSHNCRVSCRAFGTCIRFLGRQGRVREALCLFEEMETAFRCKADNYVYNNMLYVLCKKETSGEWIDVALSIFWRIESPDIYSYSNILVGLCKFGRFETALEVFRAMDRAGLVPTRSAVNILIGQLCFLSAKEGSIEKVRMKNVSRPCTILVPNVGTKVGTNAIESAVGVFWAVYDVGLLPSSFVIIQLLKELCRVVEMKEAFQVLKVVEERKMSCLDEGYSVLMQALCEHSWVEEADHLFGRMLSHGLIPKLVVYNSLISMLCKLDKLDDAEMVFKIMTSKRCNADSVTYTALIHAYGESRNWEAAYHLLIEMLGLGLIPHFNTFTLVDKILREKGRTDLCTKLEGKMETQILLKHCRAGQLKDAYQKLNSMIGKGFCPPMHVCDAFKNAFQKYGKLNKALELLERLDGDLLRN
ncbi:hypothetical protein SLA2020_384940 [Shorea laevis]